MATLTLYKNKNAIINPISAYADSGWRISGGFATHDPCQSGYLINKGTIKLEVGKTYDIGYIVDSNTIGYVQASLGSAAGAQRTNAGSYRDTLLYDGTEPLRFFSTGDCVLRGVAVNEHLAEPKQNGKTIVYNEGRRMYVGERSYMPERYVKFLDKLISFKRGDMWRHNENEIRNLFYDVQYSSKIQLIVNVLPTAVKEFYSVRQVSNRVWAAPQVKIRAYEGKPNGQLSRIKAGNFKNYQGAWFADFLRDITDPRFVNEIDALFNGAELQGRIMELTLENKDTQEVLLFTVDIKSDISKYSY